jgi:hypothetical protein
MKVHAKTALTMMAMAALLMACGGGDGSASATRVDFDAAAAQPMDTRVPTVSEPSTGAVVATGKAGNSVALYEQGGNDSVRIFARHFDASGSMAGAPVKIGLEEKGSDTNAVLRFSSRGDMAAAVWTHFHFDSSGPFVNVVNDVVVSLHQPASKAGNAWSRAIRLNLNPGKVDVQPGVVDVTFGNDGLPIVAWVEGGNAFGTFRVLVRRYAAHGDWSQQTEEVASTPLGFQDTQPRLVALPGGDNLLVLKRVRLVPDESGPNAYLVFYRFTGGVWKEGNVAGGQASLTLADAPVGDVVAYDLAANASGQVLVAWQHQFLGSDERSAIYAARLSAGSTAWSPVMMVDESASIAGSQNKVGKDSADPVVALTPTGDALFAWRQQSNVESVYNLFATRLAAGFSSSVTSPVESREGHVDGRPMLASDVNGRALLSWRQATGVDEQGRNLYSLFASRYDGQAFGAPALVEADDAPDATVSLIGPQAVALGSNDTALVVWTQKHRVWVNRGTK